MPRYLTLFEVVDLLPGFTERYVRYMVATRQIPFIKPTARKLLFDREQIERWLDERLIKEQPVEAEEAS